MSLTVLPRCHFWARLVGMFGLFIVASGAAQANFSPNSDDARCSGSNVNRCPRGPQRERPDLSTTMSAETIANLNRTFIRPYEETSGIKSSFIMTFGIMTVREDPFIDLNATIPPVPVCTMDSTLIVKEYFQLEVAESLYGFQDSDIQQPPCDCFQHGPLFGGNCSCELDNWDIQASFDNLKSREDLATSTTAFVDCTSGWCGDLIPDGYFQKRTSFFRGTFAQVYDLQLFPFDAQEFWINFTLDVPYGIITMPVKTSRYDFDVTKAGFTFTQIDCVGKNISGLVYGGGCRFKARRLYSPMTMNLIVPSALFVAIGFFSLVVNPAKTMMMRASMTMLALVVQTQLRRQILSALPPSEDLVWIDMYLFVCILVISMVMMSHAISDAMVRHDLLVMQRRFDSLVLRVLPTCLVLLIIIISLAVTTSQSVWVPVTVVLVMTLLAVAVASFAHQWFKAHREEALKAEYSVENKRVAESMAETRWLRVGQVMDRVMSRRRTSRRTGPTNNEELGDVIAVTSFANSPNHKDIKS
ncbi:uncharacterized protein MONBRDRAFT_32225 [Monosiga brevicollis MX1]|uniref:Neurotransmitter-gated ion-channel ligand-binding domain-containing protein n=1 Tax=Monosiga brevicollis TaxID=81824 RepID=A9UXJ9_MONBE|nr:uncharacterized protein MONBRDRAFT_32225 [Monosiga brevicollis MX1]EDQ90022.1 predicted protein [Monosiga brevicollis MX1]|eukprot:XP_001745444.1 hypothetical protein [Monosiga brevicollis MX1]